LLTSFERLTAEITSGAVTRLPLIDEQLRNRTRLQFTRNGPFAGGDILVAFAGEDQIWAEWIVDVLRRAGVAAHERPLARQDGSAAEVRGAKLLTVVSASYLSEHRGEPGLGEVPDLLVSRVSGLGGASLAGQRAGNGFPERAVTCADGVYSGLGERVAERGVHIGG
jgi:hypothetical protein